MIEAMLGSAAAVGSSSTAAAPLPPSPPPTRHQPPARGSLSMILVEDGVALWPPLATDHAWEGP